jgi:hypothetical protein
MKNHPDLAFAHSEDRGTDDVFPSFAKAGAVAELLSA